MYLKKMDDFSAKDMLNKLKENPGSFIEATQGSSLHGEVTDLSKASTIPRNTNQSISIQVSQNSNYIFGSIRSNIDSSIKSKAHGAREENQRGQWQSSNAWDLMVPAFTPIYAIFEGSVTNINYLEQGTFIWGYRFTLVGAKDSAFYTHLDRVTVSNGTKVKKGDLLGFVGQPPSEFKWSTHLHIALQKGKLSEFLGSGGQII
jgi:murein DD-endopeptidase MepM/ murein hydrolase activator NlpD